MLETQAQEKDIIVEQLQKYAQTILVIVFGLLPLICIPIVTAPFEYTKVLVVVAGLFIALILYSLSLLRRGTVGVGVSYTLCALWAVAGVSIVSTLLSGDIRDSLIGDLFSVHSSMFTVILASIATIWVMVRPHKSAVMRLYVLFAVSTLVLVLFHVCRLVLGADFLSFSIFTNPTASPLGTWNDLAIFLGLVVLLSLIALESLTLTRVGNTLFFLTIVLSLGMLSVINFFTVWLILSISSLALAVYMLGKNKFVGAQPVLLGNQQTNTVSLGSSLLVFIISVLFLVIGSVLGGWISNMTQVSQVEVRPSFEATLNIATQVYAQSALLGTGPNRFVDAWRLFKDTAINVTPFWNTDFNAGNGYVTTFLVTTGVLGGLAWVTFLLMYVVTGLRRLLTISESDKTWHFIGISSFVSAVYLWILSVVYVPGAVILMLASLCTGISLHAFSVLSEKPRTVVTIGNNRRVAFVLTLGVIVVIVGSVSTLYVATRHYLSVYTFNESIRSMQEGKTVEELEQEVMGAFALVTSDIFARRIAEYQLARLTTLSTIVKPTEADTKVFNDATINGIRFAQEAVRLDAYEPANWAVLAGIYNILASLEVEGAIDRVRESLTKSRELNPKNPLPFLESAIIEARAGNYDVARTYISDALRLKQNFSEALYLQAQIELAEGNVEEAIRATRSIITFEPQNAVRYYQLGVLETSRKNTTAAVGAFEQAVTLDTNYANARYLLALAYDMQGRSADARTQLEGVLALNPGNTEIQELIAMIDTEGSLARLRSAVRSTVQEPMPTTDESGSVHIEDSTETSIVTPVNIPPDATSEVIDE